LPFNPVIVGMPRSGTTLCEQILASHPAVFAITGISSHRCNDSRKTVRTGLAASRNRCAGRHIRREGRLWHHIEMAGSLDVIPWIEAAAASEPQRLCDPQTSLFFATALRCSSVMLDRSLP
jgi:hypothetical protein